MLELLNNPETSKTVADDKTLQARWVVGSYRSETKTRYLLL